MADRQDMEFGKNAVAMGLLKPTQLAEGLKAQAMAKEKGTFLSLPDCLQKRGILKPSDIAAVLAKIESLRMIPGQTIDLGTKPPSSAMTIDLGTKPPSSAMTIDLGTKPPSGAMTIDLGTKPPSSAMTIDLGTKPPSSAMTIDLGTKPPSPDIPFPETERTAGSSGARVFDGHHFGRYDILEEIGRGGMGCVYKVYDTKLKRIVALKMLLHEESETGVERFLREARAMARLKHPSIVSIYEIGKESGRNFFTMDFVEGQSLNDWLSKNCPGVRKTVEIILKIADGIQYAHENGVIHRDLKPANIMMDADGAPKIMDFGLARVTQESKRLSQSGTILGTLQYMPPEQAEGKIREIDERSDVYSLGAILYEMLTGRPPFTGRVMSEIILDIVNTNPLPPGKIKTLLPRSLDAICLKALEKRREDRYQTVKSMGEDLTRFQKGRSVQAKKIGMGKQLARKAKKNKLPVFLSVALLVSLVVIASLAIWNEKPKETGMDQKAQVENVRKIMQEVRRGELGEGMVEEYISRILRAPGPATVSSLLGYLDSADEWQRKIAIESLGKLGDSQTKVDGKDAVQSMVQRLQKIDVRKDPAEAESLVWALGRLRDPRANRAIIQVRWDSGQNSNFWNRTKIPYSWIPLEEEKDEKNAEAWNERGVMKMSKGDVEGAIQDYTRAISMDSRNAFFYNNRGTARRRKGDFLGAIEDFTQAIRISPGYSEAYCNRGNARENQGELDRALDDFTQAIRLDPQSFEAYNNRGRVRCKKRDAQGALEDFTAAIRLAPERATAYNDRGILYAQQGMLEKALQDFDRSIALDSNYGKAYGNRGGVRAQLGKMEEALDDFNQAIRIHPKDPDACLNRGLIFKRKGDLIRALQDFDRSILLDPRQPEAHAYRGVVKYEQKDMEGAMADYNEALRIDPRFAEAYLNRGVLLEQKGDIKSAIADYEKFLQLKPEASEAKALRNFIERNQ